MRAHLKRFGLGGLGKDRRATQVHGFTITELLVVIAIIVLLIAIAVPAFSSLMESSERNLAENQFKAAIAGARDAARQSGNADAAAVFLYTLDPNGGGRITIVTCIAVGSIDDTDDPTANPPGPTRHRDVFVPVASMTPTQLQRGWSVRGYAPPQTLFDGTTGSEPWYEMYDAGGQALARTHRNGNWIFPETAFYSLAPNTGGGAGATPGTSRQSFMIRFKAGTGLLDTGSSDTALFFDPVRDSTRDVAPFRRNRPYQSYRADQLRLEDKIAPDAATWVKRVLTRPDFPPSTPATADADRQLLLGDASVDTVLVRPVTELALYQEQTMAARIGAASLNRVTGTIYFADPNLYFDPRTLGQLPQRPSIDTTLFGAAAPTADEICDRVDQWIVGQYPPQAPVVSDARIFTIQPYLGQMQELVP